MNINIIEFLKSCMILQTPIIFAALSSNISSKAGYFNIGIEGIMTLSAFFAAYFSHYFQNPYIALFIVILIAILQAYILAFLKCKWGLNSILSGIAYNFFAFGLSSTLLYLTGNKGISTSFKTFKIPDWNFGILKINPMVLLAIISIFLIYLLNEKTVLGIRIKSVGYDEEFVKISGMDPDIYIYYALTISSIMAAIGGAFMSLVYIPWFSRDMIAGRGFIGLAADAIGGGSALRAGLVSILFGIIFGLSNLQPEISIKPEIFQMLPYLSVMVFFLIKKLIDELGKR
ncbi:MAG: ABC transporter permease [Tissierellia bacterium]|nr:ABC transporter permease [Tissierellia bacterium]